MCITYIMYSYKYSLCVSAFSKHEFIRYLNCVFFTFSNLLMPAGMTLAPATFTLKAYQAEDLPRSEYMCLIFLPCCNNLPFSVKLYMKCYTKNCLLMSGSVTCVRPHTWLYVPICATATCQAMSHVDNVQSLDMSCYFMCHTN